MGGPTRLVTGRGTAGPTQGCRVVVSLARACLETLWGSGTLPASAGWIALLQDWCGRKQDDQRPARFLGVGTAGGRPTLPQVYRYSRVPEFDVSSSPFSCCS